MGISRGEPGAVRAWAGTIPGWGGRNGGPWEQVGMSNKSPFIDTRPLLTADQAEIRDYRARYFDDGEPTSDWSPVSRVTISPS